MVRAASDSVGVMLDYTPETLPFLDHYRRHAMGSLPARDPSAAKPGPGSDCGGALASASRVRFEFLQLVAPMAGCYFGEVVRRSHEARWVLPDEADPSTWRIELVDCFLYFYPMGLAMESLIEQQIDGVPGAFQVSHEQREPVSKLLESQPPVREEDFYSFTVRWETLDLITHHLVEDRTLRGEIDCPFTGSDYDRHFDLE